MTAATTRRLARLCNMPRCAENRLDLRPFCKAHHRQLPAHIQSDIAKATFNAGFLRTQEAMAVAHLLISRAIEFLESDAAKVTA
jgi:hypothetical protein